MTRFQALYVKYLRIRCKGSWRWIAARYEDRYKRKIPFDSNMSFGGNQITGILLCKQAKQLLGEKMSDGWN